MAEQTTAVTRQTPQATLKTLLERAEPKMKAILPAHIQPERMVRLALLAATKTPKLYECTPESVLSSLMQAAALGLEINSALGSAYLVPYYTKGKTECQLIPGYRGLIDLARRSAGVTAVEARAVYAGEAFRVQYGTEPKIQHIPDFSIPRDDDKIVGFYAVAFLADGSRTFDVMGLGEVQKIRGRSKSGQNGPWVTDFAEMGKKTVVKRLAKYLPMSPEMAAAVDLDNRADQGFSTGTSELLDQTVKAAVQEVMEGVTVDGEIVDADVELDRELSAREE